MNPWLESPPEMCFSGRLWSSIEFLRCFSGLGRSAQKSIYTTTQAGEVSATPKTVRLIAKCDIHKVYTNNLNDTG